MTPKQAAARFEAHWEAFKGNALAIEKLAIDAAVEGDPAMAEWVLTEFGDRYKALRLEAASAFESAIRNHNFKVLSLGKV